MSYTRLTRDFYQAVEALMEGKVEEKLDPQASEGGGSHPKTDKHKKLAAMGHPKDKITHKDVLIARGVVAKEEAEIEEQLDELQENISNKHKVGDVYQPHLVDHIKNKTGTKVYFDGDDMVHEKTGKTIMNVKAHHTVGDAISAVKNLKEEAEQLDEIGDTPAGKKRLGSYVKKRVKQIPKITVGYEMAPSDRDARMVKKYQSKVNKGIGRAIDRLAKEEVQEEVDQVITENNSFEIEVPAQLSYKDYLDAAMQFVDAEDALTVAEAFYNEQDESLVIESFVRSDIEQKVKVHQNAGNQVSMPKFGTKDGKPYAEYVVTNKDDGIRRKYIHHGTMRRVENMGAKGKKDAD